MASKAGSKISSKTSSKTASKTGSKTRTQAERRAESRQAVLDSACRLFGEQGYANTSLEQIAADCDLTIRPVYHYFGNKKALFAAVNEVMEQRIMAAWNGGPEAGEAANSGGATIVKNWRAFLTVCEDPAFRRIVLIDSPNILGRERWTDSAVTTRARKLFLKQGAQDKEQRYRVDIFNRVLMGAFTEAALAVAEADDTALATRVSEELVETLFGQLSVH